MKQTEAVSVFQGLSEKDSLRLRLLAEVRNAFEAALCEMERGRADALAAGIPATGDAAGFFGPDAHAV